MRENTLDTTRTLPQLLRFVAPSIVMMLAMGIYTITDTLFVSRLVNTDALSAINIVCPMINLIIGLSSMLASGGVAVLCRDMGAGLLEKVRKNAALLCVCTIGLGCVLAIGGLLFTDELLQLLHAKGRILPYARGYLSMLLLFTPFCMLQVLYQSMFVAAGRPLLGMVLAMCAGESMLLWIWPSCPAFIWESKAAPWQPGSAIWFRLYMERSFSCRERKGSCISHGQLGMLPC